MALPTAQNQIAGNVFKTWLIMFFFALFVVAVVYIFARGFFGYNYIDALSLSGFALILAGIMNILSYFFSDKMVLGISGAREIQKKDNPTLFRTVENLAIAAGLPTPKIYVINDSSPNAFATGRDKNHAVICFTSGILEKLNKEELEGVTSHELSHINNRDTLLMSVVSILVGFIALLADILLRSMWFGGGRRDNDRQGGNAIFLLLAIISAILAPVVATLIQLAISRRREYLADSSGAYLTRNPEELATALIKISGDPDPLEAANRATAHLYIVNPLKGSQAVGFMAGLFNTHPPISERVKLLREMEGEF